MTTVDPGQARIGLRSFRQEVSKESGPEDATDKQMVETKLLLMGQVVPRREFGNVHVFPGPGWPVGRRQAPLGHGQRLGRNRLFPAGVEVALRLLRGEGRGTFAIAAPGVDDFPAQQWREKAMRRDRRVKPRSRNAGDPA